MKTKFVEAIQNYQTVEQQYRTKYKQRMERQFNKLLNLMQTKSALVEKRLYFGPGMQPGCGLSVVSTFPYA